MSTNDGAAHVGRRSVLVAVAAGLVLLAALTGVPAPAAATTPGPVTNIIGGTPVPDGTYPFQAALLDLTRGGNDWNMQICGGSLIAPSWVLTAAHCVEEGGVITDPSTSAIVLGRTVLKRRWGERHAVDGIYPSPKYDETNDADDVALIHLTVPSAYAPIRVAQVADDGFEAAGTMLTVIGWGDTIPVPPFVDPTDLFYPQRMQEVQVPVVSDATCGAEYSAVHEPLVMSKTLCAGAPGFDACFGDSGGPLFATTPTGLVEMGIVASGEGCGAPGYAGTYTEVNARSVRNFIRTTMASH
ncbi:MAG: S1 family peptidase [Acidimicrobiales bacterium]